MAGLLDLLGQIGNGSGGLFGNQVPMQQPGQQPGGPMGLGMPQMQGPSDGLFGLSSNTLLGLGAGIAGGKDWGSGIAQGLQGAQAGRAADQKLAVQQGTFQYLMGKGLDPQTAQLVAMNPDWMKEYGKAAISPPMQIAPDGSIIQSGPMGKLNRPGGVPISERMETTNPDGSKSPAFAIKPSLANPSGQIVQPGMGQPQPGNVTGPVGAADPTMSISPRQVAQANRPLVSEQSPAATSEQKASGEGLAKDYNDLRMRGDAATKKLTTLQRMAQLSPQAYEGAAAPAFQYARSLLTSFGIPAGSVPAGEEFSSLANKMVLDANNGSLGPGVSNSDVTYLAAMNPAISQTKAGRDQIIQTQTILAKRDQEVAKMANTWKQSRGTLDGFQSAIADWAEKNPLFANREQVGTFTDRFGSGGSALPPLPKGFSVVK